MKLTAKGRYAVMAVADMASQGTSEIVPLVDISRRQGISLSFLEQLFSRLRKAGVVTSHRGVKGGYQLSGAPEDIRLISIIKAVDEGIKAHGCSPEEKKACTGRNDKCLTHNLWGALETHIEQFLSAITVDDIVKQKFPVLEIVT